MHWSLAKSSLYLLYSDDIVLHCLSENAEGKYISPFHDIPMYADESQVGLTSLHRALRIVTATVSSNSTLKLKFQNQLQFIDLHPAIDTLHPADLVHDYMTT